MPRFNYNNEILESLINSPFQSQGPIGINPSVWVKNMELDHNYDLPNNVLTRQEVRLQCRNEENDALLGYLCAMAWGGQGSGPGGKRNVQKAWANSNLIQEKIENIRDNNLTREQAYDLFSKNNAIPGLGPAYFTKLLYFFHQDPTMYIMDQWTTKPILLLIEQNIIRHTAQGPTSINNGTNYRLFCDIVDDLIEVLDANSGDEVEQRLFSVGSINRQPRGHFRQFVYEQWQKRGQLSRYDEEIVTKMLNTHP